MAEVLFSVKLTPDERNAGVFSNGFDLMIYGGVVFPRQVFPVKLTPDERNTGAFCYGVDLMIYGGGVIFRRVNTRRTERRSFLLWLGLNDVWRSRFSPSS